MVCYAQVLLNEQCKVMQYYSDDAECDTGRHLSL